MTVVVAAAAADMTRGELAELAPDGWSEREADGGPVRFELWLGAEDVTAPDRLLRELVRRGVMAEVTSVPEGDEWRDALRRHHRAVDVGARLRVRPPWGAARPGALDIVIEPGMAFGTGQHATTRGCLTLLLGTPAGSVLDVGCGSGVLAIAACKLGHSPVWAIDVDPHAIDATMRNARDNGVDVHAFLCDAVSDALPDCDIAIANVSAIHVAALAGVMAGPPPHLILSGFCPDEFGVAIGPWRDRKYEVVRRIDDADWTAVALTRA